MSVASVREDVFGYVGSTVRKNHLFIQRAGSFKEANSSFIALEDMDTDVAIMLIEWIQEDR